MDEIFKFLLHSWIVTGLNINLSSSKWFLKSKNFKLGFPLGRDKQLILKKLFLKHVFVIGINLYRLKANGTARHIIDRPQRGTIGLA
jgi:hypothetical protein